MTDDDRTWMSVALRLARRGLGRTAENPSVGCVIVRDGRVVARARTADGGRPHAEARALERAGSLASGATVYVTLEPCAHWGRTPPCAKLLVEAAVARVVIAADDPDPRVDGKGVEILKTAGIDVETGVMAEQADAILAGYKSRRSRASPSVTLKLATSLDGKIALADGRSQWITGQQARARGHLLRARHDAILVGAGTARQDDPSLTCRLAGLQGYSPVRVVLDGGLTLPRTSSLVRTASAVPTWVFTGEEAADSDIQAMEAAGVSVIRMPLAEDRRPVVADVLHQLAERGVNSVLVEGGGRVAGALLRADLVDRIVLFRAPTLLGGDGRSAVDFLSLTDMQAAPRFETVSIDRVGPDSVEVLVRRERGSG